MPAVPKFTGTNIALVAVFAGVIAIATAPPEFTLASGVPISLQTGAVVLAGLVLGAWRGAAATLLYVLVGLAGAPIYSNGGAGWATFTGVTGGFIWSFTIAAFVVGWLAERIRARHEAASYTALIGASLASFPVVYAVGLPWFSSITGYPLLAPTEDGGATAVTLAMVPYVIGDLVKIAVAAAVAAYVHRAFPQLLSIRAPHFADRAADAASAAPGTSAPAPAVKAAGKK